MKTAEAVYGEPGAGNAPACLECGAIVNTAGVCLNCGKRHAPTTLSGIFASMMPRRVVQDHRGVVEVPPEREGGDPMGEAGMAMLSAKSAAEAIVRLRLGPEMLAQMEADLGAPAVQEMLDHHAREEAVAISAQRAAQYKRLLPARIRLHYCPECHSAVAPMANRLQDACSAGHKVPSGHVAAASYVLEESVAEGYWREGVTAAIALMIHFAMNGSSEGDYASAASHLGALLQRGRAASQPQPEQASAGPMSAGGPVVRDL